MPVLVAAAFDYLDVFDSCFGLLHKPGNQVLDFEFARQLRLVLELAGVPLRNGDSLQPRRVLRDLVAQNAAHENLVQENPVQSDLTNISFYR